MAVIEFLKCNKYLLSLKTNLGANDVFGFHVCVCCSRCFNKVASLIVTCIKVMLTSAEKTMREFFYSVIQLHD